MLFYKADKQYRYIKPIEAKADAFGSTAEMREKRIYPSLSSANAAKNRFVKKLKEEAEARRARKHK